MPRPAERTTPAGADPEPGTEATRTPAPATATALASLSDLPVAGLTRRRIAVLIAALVAAWVIVLFARQVGEASEASTRCRHVMRTEERRRWRPRCGGLEQELALIQRQAYIEQQAREYRLGEPREIPFILADNAPALAADVPGTAARSASARSSTGARRSSRGWISLFGSPDDGEGALPPATG